TELRASGERFRLLIENLSEVIAVLDVDNVITYVGPSVERVLGYACSDLVGRPSSSLVPPETQAKLAELTAIGRSRDGSALLPVLEFCHKDGTRRLMEV